MRQVFIALLFLLTAARQPAPEPVVRIGLNQNAATVTIRSQAAFSIGQDATRSAVITNVLALDAAAAGTLRKSDLQYRLTVEIDGDRVIVLPAGTHLRLQPAGAPFELNDRAYRGAIEVFANTRRTLT